MEGAKLEGSSAQYNGYKKFCPPAWIVSTQFSQDRSGDTATSDAGGSVSRLEPLSSDTLRAPSLVSSSSTVQEAANDVAQVTTPMSEKSKDETTNTSLISKSSSLSSKSSPFSKFKAFFHARSESKKGRSTVDKSSKLATEYIDVGRKDDTAEASKSTIKEFRWPIASSRAVDAGTGSTEHLQQPTAGLKFQPKQSPPPPPKTDSAALATASFQSHRPLPPTKAPYTASAAAQSARGPPPAPSASANNPRSNNAMGQSDSAALRSANPISAVSGYSTSTTSDLADVPSRLPYHSPGYSPQYYSH